MHTGFQCSWTDNLGHKCTQSSVVTATVSQLPYITPAAVGHLPPPVIRVHYCEVHRLARLAQLGKVRSDMDVEARMLAAADATLDEALKGIVDKAIDEACRPILVKLQEDLDQFQQRVSGLALAGREDTVSVLKTVSDLRLDLGRSSKKIRSGRRRK